MAIRSQMDGQLLFLTRKEGPKISVPDSQKSYFVRIHIDNYVNIIKKKTYVYSENHIKPTNSAYE
jgi:hypothetical protein